MKRMFSVNACSIERRMRQKAAVDLDQLKTKLDTASGSCVPVQNVRYTTKGTPMYTLDTLPSDMIHLGGELFASVAYFLGHTRVHIRRHVCDEEGYFQPTKDGVSLSAGVWDSLRNHLDEFCDFRLREKMVVVDRDVCMSKTTKESDQFIVFQRLFQRQDMSFHFVPERVVINNTELGKLCASASSLSDSVKEGLIKYSLKYFIEQEWRGIKRDIRAEESSQGIIELTESLCMCLTMALSQKITEIIDCLGCRESYGTQFMHNCLRSRADKFEECFERSLYLLNWRDVAKDFIKRNINADIGSIFAQAEFFDVLDVNELFQKVEKMYVSEEKICV